jgi:hypothetical protein
LLSSIGNTALMDRSGAMPRSAWVEIRDPDGELLASIPAQIRGGTVSADLPAFPPGTRGSIQLRTDEGGPADRDDPEVKELPTEASLMIVQMG